jgi:hypothetical protein
MILKKKEDARNLYSKQQIALYGELALEEAVNLS